MGVAHGVGDLLSGVLFDVTGARGESLRRPCALLLCCGGRFGICLAFAWSRKLRFGGNGLAGRLLRIINHGCGLLCFRRFETGATIISLSFCGTCRRFALIMREKRSGRTFRNFGADFRLMRSW